MDRFNVALGKVSLPKKTGLYKDPSAKYALEDDYTKMRLEHGTPFDFSTKTHQDYLEDKAGKCFILAQKITPSGSKDTMATAGELMNLSDYVVENILNRIHSKAIRKVKIDRYKVAIKKSESLPLEDDSAHVPVGGDPAVTEKFISYLDSRPMLRQHKMEACILIAEMILTKYGTLSSIEDTSVDLMALSDNIISGIVKRSVAKKSINGTLYRIRKDYAIDRLAVHGFFPSSSEQHLEEFYERPRRDLRRRVPPPPPPPPPPRNPRDASPSYRQYMEGRGRDSRFYGGGLSS